MASEKVYDLTPSSPVAPLPAPTTATTRALAPRQARGRSTRSTSRSTTASASTSRSSSVRRPQTDFVAGPNPPEDPMLVSGSYTETPHWEVPIFQPLAEQSAAGGSREGRKRRVDEQPLADVSARSTIAGFPSSLSHNGAADDAHPNSVVNSPGPSSAARAPSEDPSIPPLDTRPQANPRIEPLAPDALPEQYVTSGSGRKRGRTEEERFPQLLDDLATVGPSRFVLSSNAEVEGTARKRPRMDTDEDSRDIGTTSEERLEAAVGPSTSSQSVLIEIDAWPSEYFGHGAVSATASGGTPEAVHRRSTSLQSDLTDVDCDCLDYITISGPDTPEAVAGPSNSLRSPPIEIENEPLGHLTQTTMSGPASAEAVAGLSTSLQSVPIESEDEPLEYLTVTTVAGLPVLVDAAPDAAEPTAGPSRADPADIGPSAASISTVSHETIDVDLLPDMSIAEDLIKSPSPSGSKHRSSAAGTSRLSSPSASSSQVSAKPMVDSPAQTVEPLSAYTCPICFSPPTYATLTPCGHICCGECLFTAVKTTMQRAMYSAASLSDRNTARCPVCRAPIPGWNGKGAGVIGLKPRTVLTL